ncbi:hypothetical protein LHGZ1_1894 [Laribacter hongkongensis]|uniref:Uncharacterized protein n=1 Tax=Laribacter hongkongensis TaxID=168471 RepID=A0A248LJL1_9NEIS|nr:hypothetical protein LHGZ1_1894 [Laribacter hongkongensis]
MESTGYHGLTVRHLGRSWATEMKKELHGSFSGYLSETGQ